MTVSSDSVFDRDGLKKVCNPTTPEMLEWWESLSQAQKILFCILHPNSPLTHGHMGRARFSGWDQAAMRQYHAKQADNVGLNLLSAVDPKARKDLLAWEKLHKSHSK